MKQLSADWFAEGNVDFEHKKYVLLAYLQHVSREFADYRLYPLFSDLIFHYNNLTHFQKNKRLLQDSLPTKLNEEEFRQLHLQFDSLLSESEDMQTISAIVEYAIPTVNEHLETGKEIYQQVNAQLEIEPIGIVPLYKKEGYLLLRMMTDPLVKAYEYRIIFYENTDANYHGISLSHLDTFRVSLAQTYEAIKLSLIREHGKYPNPATYLAYMRQTYPEQAALLPVLKRRLLAYLR